LAQVFGIAPVYGLADQGVILPLDQPLASDPDWKEQDIFPPFLAAYQYNGKLWALPSSAQPDSLIWNKSVFANSGLDPESGPKDQSAFEAAIEKINRFDANGRLQIAGYIPGMWGGFTHWAYDWGGSVYDPATKKITATNPVNVEALQWVVDLEKEYGGNGAYNAWKSGVRGDPLWLGKAGMQWYEHYQYYSMHLAAPQDFSWGFAPVPVMGPADAQPKGNVVHTDANVMVATTKHPHEAAIVLNWFTTGPGSLAKIQISAHPSANVAIDRYALEHNLVPDWYPRELWLQNYDVLMRARQWAKIPVLGDLTPALDKAQSDAIAGKVPVQTALQQVDDAIQPKLDEALARLSK
ncbi:MAG TPA: hypothetical protein VFK80_05175, partial [Limnochordia bacterium]|nr:hypothetical protein [Limnochordia bacterium]